MTAVRVVSRFAQIDVVEQQGGRLKRENSKVRGFTLGCTANPLETSPFNT